MAYKHDYDKILTRLTTMLSRLNSGEDLSEKELALEFNVSTKTIQRDFNERLASFPIYKENKQWKMQNGFKIEKIKSLEEQLILDILEKMAESIGGNFALKSHNLLSKIRNEDFNPVYAKLNIEDITDKLDDILLIEQAIKEKKELECHYENDREGKFQARLQPLKIVNFEGFWYLVAFKDGYLEKYYLKTLSNIRTTDTIFSTDENIDDLLNNSISIWFKADIEPYIVKLHADSTATKYFIRRPLPTQSIESVHQDGTMEFTVKITDEMEIIPIIKYWIPHLKILEPLWISEMINEDLQSYLSNHI